MDNEYRIEDREDHALVILPEKVSIPHTKKLEPVMQKAFAFGYKTIVLDCTNLKFFDTAGIAYLAVYQKKQKERGGEVKLINVGNDYIKSKFQTIELHKLLSVEEI